MKNRGTAEAAEVAGVKMLEVPLWRSCLEGFILLGVGPCTAMVVEWGLLPGAGWFTLFHR